jgi:hypothetical protein
MALFDISDPTAVLKAIAEFDELGRDTFLDKYGFGHARRYFLVYGGKHYDSKAIAGVAHGFQFPGRGALKSEGFSGGNATVKKILEKLGFRVELLET